MEQVGAGDREDRVGDLLGVGDDLDQNPEFVRPDLPHGLQRAHHAVAPVDAENQPVLVGLNSERARLRPRRFTHPDDEVVETADQHRIACAADRDRTVADQLRSLQLHRFGRGCHAMPLTLTALAEIASKVHSLVSSRPPGSRCRTGLAFSCRL